MPVCLCACVCAADDGDASELVATQADGTIVNEWDLIELDRRLSRPRTAGTKPVLNDSGVDDDSEGWSGSAPVGIAPASTTTTARGLVMADASGRGAGSVGDSAFSRLRHTGAGTGGAARTKVAHPDVPFGLRGDATRAGVESPGGGGGDAGGAKAVTVAVAVAKQSAAVAVDARQVPAFDYAAIHGVESKASPAVSHVKCVW